jgi:hypothetical protein
LFAPSIIFSEDFPATERIFAERTELRASFVVPLPFVSGTWKLKGRGTCNRRMAVQEIFAAKKRCLHNFIVSRILGRTVPVRLVLYPKRAHVHSRARALEFGADLRGIPRTRPVRGPVP